MNGVPKIVNKSLETKSFTASDVLKFLIPSLIGILLFIVPITTEDGITIPVAFLASQINVYLGDYIPFMTVIIMIISVLGSLVAITIKPHFIIENPGLNALFNIRPFWFIIRLLGAIFAGFTFYQIGPAMVHSEDTGALLMYDLLPILFSTLLLAALLLPLLLNFGLMEFFGALFAKVMRPLFKLPGRSSLDCLASWVGDATIGVLLTTKQYEEGYYTKREAAVIATTFSVVSITFSIVIVTYLNLEEYFFYYYGTIIVAGLAAALVMPRIPPLSRKADTSYENVELIKEEGVPFGISAFRWGGYQAVTKAKGSRFNAVLKEGTQNVMDMWLGVLPIVMAIGTIALIIAEYTPVFELLGAPFIPLLTLMQIPEATAAAPTMVVGFADMFLPAVVGSGIESPLTRFVIACISVTQLIYMSETGGLLLGSKLPLSIVDLLLVFLLRTLITLPIIVVIAHFIF